MLHTIHNRTPSFSTNKNSHHDIAESNANPSPVN